MKDKDPIKIALAILAEYCEKHSECEKCRFFDKDGERLQCMLMYTMPCDWKKEIENTLCFAIKKRKEDE